MHKNPMRKHVKQVTRSRLLDVAERVLLETDFRSSTLNIAEKASVAHGTVFFHFKNRDELILSVVRRLVLTVTDRLHAAYVQSESLEKFLIEHFHVVRLNWRTIRALLSGFSSFSEDVKQQVIALLAVANYYLVESFNRWADKGLMRTTAWQGVMTYLSFFGDYMFEDNNISKDFTEQFINLMGKPQNNAAPITAEETAKVLCESCAMILHRATDFANQDTTNRYCRYCTDEQGNLRSFDAVLKTMTTFLEKTQVLNKKSARNAALVVLAKNPAWKDVTTKPTKEE
ncbi:MAG: TetR/AcrR family transcriptional regulator [candidate division WOR-3 bacterium]|nr:MAG: TetR/AcrR family transcriptional regulator [candidate division WOR-3 bacterium]